MYTKKCTQKNNINNYCAGKYEHDGTGMLMTKQFGKTMIMDILLSQYRAKVLSLWHNWPYVASSLAAHLFRIWRESSDWERCFRLFCSSFISLLVRERMKARDGHSDFTIPASNSRNCSSGLEVCFSGSSRVL